MSTIIFECCNCNLPVQQPHCRLEIPNLKKDVKFTFYCPLGLNPLPDFKKVSVKGVIPTHKPIKCGRSCPCEFENGTHQCCAPKGKDCDYQVTPV